MHSNIVVRVLACLVLAGCASPADAPAQPEAPGAPFVDSQDPAVREAARAIAARRGWRATEVLDSAYPPPRPRPPEVSLVASMAAAASGTWSGVERELASAPWLDSLFEGEGREMLARAALGRGDDTTARTMAERAVLSARSERERGVRLVLLARALDRLALGDTSAAAYARAARALPLVGDWLELRAAGVTADAARRRSRYARVRSEVARGRIARSEAQARERWRDFAGAATAYAELGQPAEALRLRLMADTSDATRAAVRREALALIASAPRVADARGAIAVLDASFAPLPTSDELVVARAAASTGLEARAAAGFARVAQDSSLGDADRFTYGTALSRLGRDADAVAQFARVRAATPHGPAAAYQHARSLLRAGRSSAATAAMRRVMTSFPRDTAAAAPALFLLADLATDAGRDADARRAFRQVAERYPTSHLAPAARFRAAIIAYAAGSFRDAARELDTLVARYPRSTEALAAGYWAGRASTRAGDPDRARARWRAVIASEPLSYYSMMSARRLGESPWTPAPAAPQPVDSVIERAAARAALLEELGMRTEESLEYDYIVAQAGDSPARHVAAAAALHGRGETARAIALARRALFGSAQRDTRLLQLAHPLPYRDVIEAAARERGLDPALIAALIHQESSFNPRAVSRVGAVGLMQLLPGVARSLARASRMGELEMAMLYQPDVNVRLGAAHLDAMLGAYPHPAYALAAYNAGGTPVRRWRTKAGTTDPEVFIERIPYDETRDYVRILLRNQATYRALYDW